MVRSSREMEELVLAKCRQDEGRFETSSWNEIKYRHAVRDVLITFGDLRARVLTGQLRGAKDILDEIEIEVLRILCNDLGV